MFENDERKVLKEKKPSNPLIDLND